MKMKGCVQAQDSCLTRQVCTVAGTAQVLRASHLHKAVGQGCRARSASGTTNERTWACQKPWRLENRVTGTELPRSTYILTL